MGGGSKGLVKPEPRSAPIRQHYNKYSLTTSWTVLLKLWPLHFCIQMRCWNQINYQFWFLFFLGSVQNFWFESLELVLVLALVLLFHRKRSQHRRQRPNKTHKWSCFLWIFFKSRFFESEDFAKESLPFCLRASKELFSARRALGRKVFQCGSSSVRD